MLLSCNFGCNNQNTRDRKSFNYVRKQSFVSRVNNCERCEKKHLLTSANRTCQSIDALTLLTTFHIKEKFYAK